MRRMDQTPRTCPWCSTPIPPEAHACPRCGAAVEGSVADDIPGLTTVDPKAPRVGLPDTVPNPIEWLRTGREGDEASEDAFRPPNDAVRLEMRKIELAAQIENAGTTVMNPDGDESIEVGPPSDEAIDAFEAGLLDPTGPAGETDLAEVAEIWEGSSPRPQPGA